MLLEKQLLLKVIKENNFRPLEVRGIKGNDFNDPEARMLFSLIRDYYKADETKGDVPTLEYIKTRYPLYLDNVTAPAQTIDSLVAELVDIKLKVSLMTALEIATDTVESEPMQTANALQEALSRMVANTVSIKHTTLSKSTGLLREQYDKVKNKKGTLGITYPWPSLSKATMGIQKGEFVIIYARPKSMKSWLLLQVAINAYLVEGKRILFYSREMQEMQILQRAAALIARVDYENLRCGGLNEDEENAYKATLELLENFDDIPDAYSRKPCFKVLTDKSVTKSAGVALIKEAAEEIQPDLICIDSMYLMANDREGGVRSVKYSNQAAITQDIKQLALSTNVPVLGTTQGNRKGENENMGMADIGYSDSYGQDCDYALKLTLLDSYHKCAPPPYTTQKNPRIFVRISGAREFRFEGFIIDALPAYYFKEVGTFKTEQEFLDALDVYKKATNKKAKKKKSGESKPNILSEVSL